ncbi:DUF2339 domain-containing protein [uncultured Psychrosphaera sp.]|uniref:DUF2339 domain-containing protein n=1 Tax=uncultured Psychrosphaera sp. TaxID=1403522 RepID=UPI002610716B|nr:DUF2339 domain-containing protein [uncultured Psychrosphaera sp.]
MAKTDIDTLKSELGQLKAEFTQRIDRLENKINELSNPSTTQDPLLDDNSLIASASFNAAHTNETFITGPDGRLINGPAIQSSVTQGSSKASDKKEPSAKEEPSAKVQPSASSTKIPSAWLSRPTLDASTRSNIKTSVSDEPVKVDVISKFFSTYFTALLNVIVSTLFEWFKPVAKIYQSYKERGMLGIFTLTILGIGLTLAGFGYLMQLLIDQMGAGAKSLLMFVAALLVMTLGIVVKRKTSFHEFSTAIVSLGLLLLYSTVYFAGSVYHVIPYMLVAVLYLFIALSSHAIALWLDTKVVAALGIIGISLMPMLSNIIVEQPNYYLLSLAFVTISSLVISYRYVGRWLANISLIFVFFALEWVVNIDTANLSAFFIDAFYLIFFAYVGLSLINRDDTHKQSLLFWAGLVGTNLYLFIQTTSLFSDSLSVIFAFNCLVSIGASYVFYKIRHPLTHIMVLVAAIWGVFAIISVIGQAYWGIAWAVEGLFLLYIGRHLALPSVINQGQSLTGLSLLYGAAILVPYFPVPALTSIDGWTLCLSLVLIIGIWSRFINDSELFNQLTIKKIKPLLMLIESIWLSVLILACAHLWLGIWTAPLVILIQFTLLLRAKACKQTSIEIFSALLVLVPILYILQVGIATNNYHFYAFPLAIKSAVVLIIAQLWLFAEYYRRYQPDSKMVPIAEGARIAFYLIIPVCWLGSALRNLDQYVLMILWFPPMIAVFFAQKIKHNFIVLEAKVLIGLASVALVFGLGTLPILASAITLVLFISCYVLAQQLNKRKASALYQYVCNCGLLAIGVAVPIWLASIYNDALFPLIFAAFYWGALFNLSNIWTLDKEIKTVVYLISGMTLLASWLLITKNPFYASIAVIYIAAALYKKEQRFKLSIINVVLGKNSELILHVIGAVTYLILLESLNHYRLDLLIAPVLAVHGALILFLKDRRLTTVKFSFGLISLGIVKLALIDAEYALLWQKVILFMGIGVFILGASFWYQKLEKTD